MFNALVGQFTNIDRVYQSYEPTIQSAIQILRTEPVLDKMTTHNPHYKGYRGNQVVSEFTNTRTNTTIKNFSTCHLHLKHHKIHHPDTQTEAK